MNNEQQFTFKEKIAYYLEDTETSLGQTINLVILGLIFLSLGIFVAETYAIPQPVESLLNYIDLGILIIFTVEYLIRLWSAQDKSKFLFSIFSIFDLLAIIPLLVGIIDIRFFRIFRWFRVLRMIRFIEFETTLFKLQIKNELVLTRILLILFSVTFVYSGLIYQIEHHQNSHVFRNFFDALYFCVVTMTTVGFGDVIPLSSLGRGVTIMMIISGVILIPWQIAELTQQLMKTVKNHQNNLSCYECGLDSHDNDALFCKRCGKKLVLTHSSLLFNVSKSQNNL
ncbi:Ion transport protein [Gloeothece citriformis PCC 7424]|uniref:Ion transport protein n=1 Tax=Gloeothece citriformis (strain PCC 7424) TaxID=65393 RepID=B7KEZ4_GLOC7|nr:ion transporter [Gloeothece citriformis]ACK70450.1 Ion transport protein [Gloeothece citriformis PCC 7424]